MTLKNVKGMEKLVKKIFTYLNSYQSINLAGMVYSLIQCPSPLISQITRCFPHTKTYRHKRKRIERFLRNEKCLLGPCKIQYLKWITSLTPYNKRQAVIIDYTFLGRYMILWAALPFKKRSLPLYFSIIRNPHVTKIKKERMVYLEKDFLRFLKIHLPQDRKWVITADRGFGNQRNIRLCQSIGFDYVLRVKGDIRVSAKSEGKGKSKRLTNRLIKNLPKAKWRTGLDFQGISTNLLSLTEGTDDPWYLLTSLKNPNTVQRIYEQRFWIEEMFRDMKTHQEIKKTLLRDLNAVKRLAFCLQLSYSIVFSVGFLAKQSKLIKKKLLGLTKASFVFTATKVLTHLPQKFTVFLKKVIKSLRLGRAVLDTG